jgi:hypothetical protein
MNRHVGLTQGGWSERVAGSIPLMTGAPSDQDTVHWQENALLPSRMAPIFGTGAVEER